MPVYDLRERTVVFARSVRLWLKTLPFSATTAEDGRQLIRSSGSIGANCIEANDSIGKNDKLMRFRISRKEARESTFWLRLFEISCSGLSEVERKALLVEANELQRILSAIIIKIEGNFRDFLKFGNGIFAIWSL